MGWLARTLGIERRYDRQGDGWGAVGRGMTGGGALNLRGAISAERAQTVATFFGCVELTAATLGSLPASLVVDTPDGRQPAPASAPEQRLLRRPNEWMGWPGLVSFAISEMQLHGNSIWKLDHDGRGIVGLTPVPWPLITPGIINAGDGGAAALVFDLMQASPEARLLALPGRLLSSDVMHLRSRSDFGILGRSILSRAGGAVYEALELQTAARATWSNGLRPSAVMTAPAYLTDVQRKRREEFVGEFTGALAAGKVPLLEGGWKLETIAMSSVDAEFLGQRQFSVDEICRWFGIPSVLMQLGQRVPADLSPYTAAFASQALAPMVASFEAEFDHAVLPDGMHLQLDMSGLLRGSYSAAVGALCAATQSGITTPNDARRSLGLPPLPNGDTLRTSSAPAWPADRPGVPALHPSPGPTGNDGLPEPGTHQGEGAGG